MPRSNVRRGAASAVAAAGVFALGLGVAAPANATVDPISGAVTIDLLAITDLHGALVTMPNIAHEVAEIRAANPDTLFASVGDSIGGSTFQSAIQQDTPTLETLNEAGLDVSTVGNHEFDQGYPDLRDRVEPYVDFPYLGANVEGSDLEPYWIETLNGVDVAFIGTVTQETASIVSPDGIAGLDFTDPVAVTDAYAAQLSDGDPANGEADVIVALAHEGTSIMRGLGPDVDVVFTGHTHVIANTTTDSGAPVVQAGASGEVLSRVTVVVDPTTGTVVPTVLPNIEIEEYEWDATVPEEEQAPGEQFDPVVAATVRAAFARADELGNEVVGTIGAPIRGGTNTGAPSGTRPPENRGTESPLGALVAEALLAKANDFALDADFGVINPGGLRADLDPNGDLNVTFSEAFGVSPFGNTVGTVDLTAAQVYTMLEQQFGRAGDRPTLALGLSSGVGYIYDPTAPTGSKVSDVFVDGVRLDPADTTTTFRVATINFLVEGGDAFTVFTEGTGGRDTGYTDVQALSDYIEANPGLTPTPYQSSVGVTEVTDLSQPVAPGDTVQVRLSSLSFTQTSDAKPTEVVVFDDATDVELGSAPIDSTITVANNETGQATVSFTVPEDAADGAYDARFEFAPEGVPAQFITLPYVVEAAAEPTPEPTDPTPTAPAPTDPPVDGGDDQAGPDEGTLPETGAELAGPLVIVAMLVLLAGLGLVLRRRTV